MTSIMLILSILQEYPEGLSAQKLYILIHRQRAVAPGTLHSELSNRLKRGDVQKVGRRPCGDCGKVFTIYTISRQGANFLAEQKNKKSISC